MDRQDPPSDTQLPTPPLARDSQPTLAHFVQIEPPHAMTAADQEVENKKKKLRMLYGLVICTFCITMGGWLLQNLTSVRPNGVVWYYLSIYNLALGPITALYDCLCDEAFDRGEIRLLVVSGIFSAIGIYCFVSYQLS